MIYRRSLVRSDMSFADSHYAIQISMGWEEFHLRWDDAWRRHLHAGGGGSVSPGVCRVIPGTAYPGRRPDTSSARAMALVRLSVPSLR